MSKGKMDQAFFPTTLEFVTKTQVMFFINVQLLVPY